MVELRAQLYASAAEFLRTAEPFLIAAEAKYSLMLGVALRLRNNEAAAEPKHDDFLATVSDESGSVVAAALLTPPYKIVLTEANGEALETLVRAVWTAGLRPPAVAGPPNAARGFAERYVARAGGSLRPGLQMRIHSLTAVQASPGVAGALRHANNDDIELLAQWGDRFQQDVGVDVRILGTQLVASTIAERRLFVWEDERPVSMAAWSRPTPRSVSINLVYTPPRSRCKGYATACVASLSEQLLAEGRSMLCLFTDLSNPTSNAIYSRIGYEPVSDWHDWWFEA